MSNSKSDLLNEVLGDVKAVKETAIQAAMSRLQETFEPTVRSLISQKISEDEYEEDEMDNVDPNIADEDDIDIDDILRELEDEDDELEPAIEPTPEPAIEPVPDLDAVDDFEEDELDEIIKELEEELGKQSIDEDGNAYEDESDTGLADGHGMKGLSEVKRLRKENRSLKSELNEVTKAMIVQKNVISEVNLLNSKLMFLTKITGKYNMSKGRQMKVLEAFDRATNVREVKLTYAVLCETLSASKQPTKKNTINESIRTASSRKKSMVNEGKGSNGQYNFAPRWKKIAGMTE